MVLPSPTGSRLIPGVLTPPLLSVSEFPCSRQNVRTLLVLSAFAPGILIHSRVSLLPNFLALLAFFRPGVCPFC